MSVFNDKKDRRKKTKNGSRGTQRPGLNCEFVEYFWGDVWEVFGGIDLFHLMVVHSGCYFLEAAGNFHIQTYSFISPMGVKVPFFFYYKQTFIHLSRHWCFVKCFCLQYTEVIILLVFWDKQISNLDTHCHKLKWKHIFVICEISYSSAVGLAIRYSKLGSSKEEPSGFQNVFLNESHKENSISLSA